MTRILFVCHGNICRSPMAEFCLKDLACRAGRDVLDGCTAILASVPPADRDS